MAYESPQRDNDNLPEGTGEPESTSFSPRTSGGSAPVGGRKTDPGDYSTLPRSYLNVLSKSRPETYEEEMPNAGWGKTLLGVAFVTLVTFGMNLLLAPSARDALRRAREEIAKQGQDPNTEPYRTLFQWTEAATSPLLALTVPITFFAGAGLLFMLARAVRDKEEGVGAGAGFMEHAYLLSLSYTPLKIVAALMNILSLLQSTLVACLSGIITFGLLIYQLYNAGVSMQASQKLAPVKAQMVAFVPWVVGVILVIVVAVLGAASLLA